jgi:hypothetical protein
VRPRPADERPHRPGPDPGWEESWHFDFAAADGSLGGFVRLALRPGDGTAWYWAYLAGPRRAVVVVRDHELDPPRAGALEVRGPGLWAQVVCETPLDHWSAGLEAAGVALEDPAEGLRGERGHPVPLGLDLEWEATGPPVADDPGYALPALVHGEVLVGVERLALDGRGWWVHRWGAPPWREDGWWWAAGNVAGGTAVTAGGSSRGGPGLSLARSGEAPMSAATLTGGDGEIVLEPRAWVLVPLPEGRGLARALCSWSVGGERGWGWSEWLQAPTA